MNIEEKANIPVQHSRSSLVVPQLNEQQSSLFFQIWRHRSRDSPARKVLSLERFIEFEAPMR